MHREEQIMTQIEAKVTGLPTTQANVYRGRAYDLDELILPALLLINGEDDQISEEGPDLIISLLQVEIEIVALAAPGGIDTLITQIREEVNIALATDSEGAPKIDLEFVVKIEETGTTAPEHTGLGEQVTGRRGLFWPVEYKRSRQNPAN